ncbi:MAG: NYN domain-containing protein [Aquificaceae bacterium]
MSYERIVILIDGSNLFHAIRYLNIRIDYSKLVEFLREDRRLVRSYFYGAIPQEKDIKKNTPEWESFIRQRRFLEDLSVLGIKVKTAHLRKLPSGEYLEKEVDIMLATDMLSMAYMDAYDTAILITGDSDFSYTVEEVQRIGKRVENASFKRTSSYQLRKTCDRFILLDDYIDRFVVEEKPLVTQEMTFWEKIARLWRKL